MGCGEETYDAFWDWYRSLSDAEAQDYASRYPEPDGWHGSYEQIRNSRK